MFEECCQAIAVFLIDIEMKHKSDADSLTIDCQQADRSRQLLFRFHLHKRFPDIWSFPSDSPSSSNVRLFIIVVFFCIFCYLLQIEVRKISGEIRAKFDAENSGVLSEIIEDLRGAAKIFDAIAEARKVAALAL